MDCSKKFIAIIILLFVAAFSNATDTITLLTHTSPPYVTDKNKGIAVDRVTQLFKKAEIPFKLENYPLARALRLAEITPGHCVFPIQRTQDRETKYAWVSPIFTTHSAIYSVDKSENEFRVLADLHGKRIGVQRGSADEEYFTSLSDHLSVTLDTAGTEAQNVQKLAKGRVEFWVTDTQTSKYYQELAKINLTQHFIFRSTLRSLACNPETPHAVIEKLSDCLKEFYLNSQH